MPNLHVALDHAHYLDTTRIQKCTRAAFLDTYFIWSSILGTQYDLSVTSASVFDRLTNASSVV